MNEINRLVIATGNTHKTEEIRKLLGPYIKIIEDLKFFIFDRSAFINGFVFLITIFSSIFHMQSIIKIASSILANI